MEKHLQTAKPRIRKRELATIVGKKFGLLKILDERRIKE